MVHALVQTGNDPGKKMTESTSGHPRQHARGHGPALLIGAGVVALCVFLMLDYWQQQNGSLLLSLIGFGLALGTGIQLGRWWPTQASSESAPAQVRDDEQPQPEPVERTEPILVSTASDNVSALADEEHVVTVKGDDGPKTARAEQSSATDQQDTVVASANEDDSTGDRDDPTSAANKEQPDTALDLAAGDAEALADIPTPAVAASTAADAARVAALAAKDQVIESLENIVKENRDRWSNFEAEREELDRKIESLEDELRIATELFETGPRDQPSERPQVLSRA